MEYLIALGLLSTGYALSKRNIPPSASPNGENIYFNRDYQKVQKSVLKRSTDKFVRFAEGDPSLVMPGPPKPLLNKIDYQNSNEKFPVEYHVKPLSPNENIKIAGIPGTVETAYFGESLTGEPIKPDKFKHNNMVPFFGAKITQNTDNLANRNILESHTGQDSNYRMKQEVGRLFPVQNNITNPYGMQNMTDFNRQHIVPPNARNNEAPIQQIHVGPGLNKGYTSKPSGGFQQADTRDYVIPKTVDELRTKDNPKVSYRGRIVSGKHISRRGIVGNVAKNNPDSFYINSPDRYFTTPVITAATQRPSQVIKSTKRKITSLRENFRLNPASNQTTSKHRTRVQNFTESRKNIYKKELYRNLDAAGTWLGKFFDYGKKTIDIKEQNRQFTQCNERTGDIAPTHPAGYVKDPNDIARTTIKETTLSSNNGAAPSYNSGGIIYDPNQVARTTIKETTLSENNGTAPSLGNRNGYIKNPNDIARTTTKETTINNSYLGAASGDKKSRMRLLDVVKTTLRQLLVGNGTPYLGGVNDSGTGGYINSHNKTKAKFTNRQTTNRAHLGGAHHKEGIKGAYINKHNKVNAKITNRQTTTREHFSGAKSSISSQMDNTMARNMRTNENKEHIAKGRKPTTVGPKKIIDKSFVNMKTKRSGDTKNRLLQKRGVASTKTYNSLPDPHTSGQRTHENKRSSYKQTNRIDPSLLDAFKNNPYTHSLHSWVF